MARYGHGGRLARDLGYLWMTRRRKKTYTAHIDFKQVNKHLKPQGHDGLGVFMGVIVTQFPLLLSEQELD